MKKVISIGCFLMTALVTGTVTMSCSSDDEPKKMDYLFTLDAGKPNTYGVAETRGLSESGKTLNAIWQAGDKAFVYTDGWATKMGELSPMAGRTGTNQTKLDGTVSSTGVKKGDWLNLITPRDVIDYSDQTGLLADIASKWDYATATVTVTDFDNGKIIASTAQFTSQQAVVKFVLSKSSDNNPLNVKTLFITSSSGQLAVKSTLNGSVTYGNLTVTAGADTNIFYVALRNDNASGDTYTITTTDGTTTYNYTRSDVIFKKGKYYIRNVKMKGPDDTYSERENYGDADEETWD